MSDKNENLYLVDRPDCPMPEEEYQDSVDSEPENTPGETSREPIELIDITEVVRKQATWLIKDRIEDTGLGVIVGASGSGKTFNALKLGFSVATGISWMGQTVDRTGTVIYFCLEGRDAFLRRNDSLQEHHDIKIPKGRFYLPKLRVEFNAPGVRIMADEIAKLPEPPALIIIDTVSRAIPAGDNEDIAKDMMAFLNALYHLIDRFKCVVCLVHHTGHGAETQRRARGSSTLPAAADWTILVKDKQLAWTKRRDGETPKPVSFELIQVGDSAVIEYSESTTEKAPGIRLTKGERLAQETLWAVCDSLRHYNVPLEDWRKQFYRLHTGDSSSSKKMAFHRARKGLIEKKLAVVDQDIYSPYVPSATEVTKVTEGNNVTAVTGERVTERNTGRRPVTAVTHPDSDTPQTETDKTAAPQTDKTDRKEGDLF